MCNTRCLSVVLFSMWFVLSSVASARSEEDKGLQKCPDNQVCFSINPTALQSNTLDVTLQYRYSDPQGTGKGAVLDNGSTLKSGDKFTINLEARETRYVYLFHFDSSGQLNELLHLSGKRNQVAGGSKLVLPAPDQHFLLDNNTGVETIHTIVSKTELTGLRDKYRAILNGKPAQRPLLTIAANDSIGKQNKGLCVRLDAQSLPCPEDQPVAKSEPPAPHPQNSPPLQAQGGRAVICQGGEGCRDSFTIWHIAR